MHFVSKNVKEHQVYNMMHNTKPLNDLRINRHAVRDSYSIRPIELILSKYQLEKMAKIITEL